MVCFSEVISVPITYNSTSLLVPTGAPENLRETFVDDRTITIQWEPVECSHRNGEIIGYNVTYYLAGEMQKSRSMVSYDLDSIFSAMRLIFDMEYVFEVQAVDSYGTGPPASITVWTLDLQGKIIAKNYIASYYDFFLSLGIVIVYDDRPYQNNSIVNLDAEGGILECFTNKSGCCNVQPNQTGEWIYPNGSQVQIGGNNGDFYRTRGVGVVNLIWTKNASIPNGVFCCEIPPSQVACIGVYPQSEGINNSDSQISLHNSCHLQDLLQL